MLVYRRKKKSRGIGKIAKKTLEEFFMSMYQFICTNMKLFIYIVQIMFFLIFVEVSAYISVGAVFALYVVLLFLTEYLFRLNSNVRNETETGIPVPPERFTQVDEHGYISVEKEEESIQYLCDVENYLIMKGFLKSDTSTM